MDAAKSRADREERLSAFYAFIGYAGSADKGGNSAPMCKNIRRIYDQFLTGDIGPTDAHDFRTHLSECADCFWAFNDWVQDRKAWGYVPNPAVSALRERWRSLDKLQEWLGALPVALDEVVTLARQNLSLNSRGPVLVPTGRTDGDEVPAFAGFGLRVGDPVDVYVLDHKGKGTERSLHTTVLHVDCSPKSRSASIVLGSEDLRAITGTLAACAHVPLQYSLAGEIDGGVATLSVQDFPEELGDLRITQWFVVETPAEAETDTVIEEERDI